MIKTGLTARFSRLLPRRRGNEWASQTGRCFSAPCPQLVRRVLQRPAISADCGEI